MKELEDRAHAHKVLLSSDALRHLAETKPGTLRSLDYLEFVIGEAKVTYPTEDGWIVINAERMRELCSRYEEIMQRDPAEEAKVSVDEDKKVGAQEPTHLPARGGKQREQQARGVPTGAGSLAEAILAGNVPAAYQLIGNRPMVALADASSDLDALYRQKQGHPATVSDLLTRQAEALEPDQIKEAINALTSALDGVYTSEQEAVRMAILKAVKAVA